MSIQDMSTHFDQHPDYGKVQGKCNSKQVVTEVTTKSDKIVENHQSNENWQCNQETTRTSECSLKGLDVDVAKSKQAKIVFATNENYGDVDIQSAKMERGTSTITYSNSVNLKEEKAQRNKFIGEIEKEISGKADDVKNNSLEIEYEQKSSSQHVDLLPCTGLSNLNYEGEIQTSILESLASNSLHYDNKNKNQNHIATFAKAFPEFCSSPRYFLVESEADLNVPDESFGNVMHGHYWKVGLKF